ncbi:MAG: hypothetical protein ABII74_07990 [Elusimicrobiota bacterium]
MAKAEIEYRLRNDLPAVLELNCSACGNQNMYSYTSILKFIPEEMLSKMRPNNHEWSILLGEMGTADKMEYRSFFGERILAKISNSNDLSWQGVMISESQFKPELLKGTLLGGIKLNGFYVIEYSIENNIKNKIIIESIPSGSDIGGFFAPKQGDLKKLQAANVFCSNPSCGHIFNFLYSDFQKNVQAVTNTKEQKGWAKFHLSLECNLCGTQRIVEEVTFQNLFKV